jgi:hypothetical protein
VGITGNLKTMVLSELLQWLSLGVKTGTLLVERRGIQKRIFFVQGRIVSTSSSDPREYLGQFLVSHGYISEEELRMAMEVQEESSILLGKILVMINAISEGDLLRLMKKKAEESIYDIFLWPEGEFEFIDNEMPDQQMVALSLDVTGIVMEGLRRFDEWKQIRQRIPSFTVVPRIVKPIAIEKLSEQEKLVVPYIDGERTVEEIAVQTHNPDFVVAKIAFEGLREGVILLDKAIPDAEEVQETEKKIADDVEHFLRRGRSLIDHDPETAWKIFKAASDLDPSDARPRDALRQTETRLAAFLKAGGVEPQKIPVLNIAISEVTNLSLNPNEGFILSRINGSWDVKSIARISPIREMEVLLIFRRFLAEKVIRWKQPL